MMAGKLASASDRRPCRRSPVGWVIHVVRSCETMSCDVTGRVGAVDKEPETEIELAHGPRSLLSLPRKRPWATHWLRTHGVLRHSPR